MMLGAARSELQTRPISSGISQSIMGYAKSLVWLRHPQMRMCFEQRIRDWWLTSIDSRANPIALRRPLTAPTFL
jgi:hypothetical protein